MNEAGRTRVTPCPGAALTPVSITISGGAVMLDDDYVWALNAAAPPRG